MALRHIEPLLLTAIFAISSVLGTSVFAEPKNNTQAQEFHAYLESELFSEDPLSPEFLSEYRKGHWSWNITQVVRSYTSDNEPRSNLVKIIEESIPLDAEYTRFSDEEALQDEEKRKINRYHLDYFETDRLRYFSKTFLIPIAHKDGSFKETLFFDVVFYIFKKHGALDETVNANLFWRTL